MNPRRNPGGSSRRPRPAARRHHAWSAEDTALLDTALTNEQIAAKIGRHVNTVRRHRGRLRKRAPTAYDPTGDAPLVLAEARIAYAQSRLYQLPDVDLVNQIVAKFGVAARIAREDVADARAGIIRDSVAERPAVRAMATQQFKSIAVAARAAGQYGPAVAAWREIGRLHGAYEPDVLKIVPAESLELGAIIGVLSPAGKAALDTLLEDIERARADGQLPALEAAAGEAGETEIVDLRQLPEFQPARADGSEDWRAVEPRDVDGAEVPRSSADGTETTEN